MLSTPARVALILFASAFGVWGLATGRWLGGGMGLLGAGVLLLGQVLHGPIFAALRAHRQGDSERARQLLARINPDRLVQQDRGYYHLLHGLLFLEAEQPLDARPTLFQALNHLRKDNDRSVAHCKLAEAFLLLNDPAMARRHVEAARALRHRAGVDQFIAHLEERLLEAEEQPTAGMQNAKVKMQDAEG